MLLKFSGRFARTLDYIRSKMDVASTSTLYPSKDEIRSWQASFESLLSHKCQFIIAYVTAGLEEAEARLMHPTSLRAKPKMSIMCVPEFA